MGSRCCTPTTGSGRQRFGCINTMIRCVEWSGYLVRTSTVADSCSVKFQGSLLNPDSLWEACGLLPCFLSRIIMNHHVYSDCKPNVTTLRIYWRYSTLSFASLHEHIKGIIIILSKQHVLDARAHTQSHTHTSHRTSIAVLHKSVLFAACKDIVHALGTHVHTVNHSWFHCKLRTSATEVEAVWDAIRPLPASGSLMIPVYTAHPLRQCVTMC